MLDGTYFYECACGSDEHTIRFTLNKAEKEVYLSVFLNQYRPWWKRVYVAIRYIFGYKCRYGHWDNWLMDENDAVRLRDMFNDFIDSAH